MSQISLKINVFVSQSILFFKNIPEPQTFDDMFLFTFSKAYQDLLLTYLKCKIQPKNSVLLESSIIKYVFHGNRCKKCELMF